MKHVTAAAPILAMIALGSTFASVWSHRDENLPYRIFSRTLRGGEVESSEDPAIAPAEAVEATSSSASPVLKAKAAKVSKSKAAKAAKSSKCAKGGVSIAAIDDGSISQSYSMSLAFGGSVESEAVFSKSSKCSKASKLFKHTTAIAGAVATQASMSVPSV